MLPRQCRTLSRLLPMTSLALCVGCAPGAFEKAVNGCQFMPLVTYSQDVQNRLADEMEAAAGTAVWPGVVTDYATLRDAVRACRKVEK